MKNKSAQQKEKSLTLMKSSMKFFYIFLRMRERVGLEKLEGLTEWRRLSS